ncbi:uncharacterized protein LOC130622302 [Hydractinia symbiolongicarpus]|uniref:uncharacterized protein LOC130622302 n=1 Tax=Hydractinia symbiolongicarpus TaxID=13093 RepID=UPI00254FE9A6|nr:uncharacterized protein LOC130622302 [Hydractinia symbiolongicarpus]
MASMRLFIPMILFLSCVNTYNFNYKLDTSYSFRDGDLPIIFDKTLRELANAKDYDKVRLERKTFEHLITDLTGQSWFPRVNAYFENANVLSRDNVDVRNYTVKKIMQRMPKYNVTHFWNVPMKYLINETAFYTSQGTNVAIELLKGIYGETDVAKKIKLVPNPNGPYMNAMYMDVFKLTQKLQEKETLKVIKSFGIETNERLTFVTHSSFDSVNEKFATLISQNLHGDFNGAKKTYDDITKLITRMLRYRSSVYEWSKTCPGPHGNVPQTNYKEETLNSISERCFLQKFDVVADRLYGIVMPNKNIINLNMGQINVLSKVMFNKTKLKAAFNYTTDAVKRVNEISQKNKEPLVLLADNVGINAKDLKSKSFHTLLTTIHDLDWQILLKLFPLNDQVKVDAEFVLFESLYPKLNEIAKFDYNLNQWRISSPEVILDSLNNRMTQSVFNTAFDNNVDTLRNLKLERVERMFGINDSQLQTTNIVSLSEEIYGLNATKIFRLYNLNSDGEQFFNTAKAQDIGALVTPLNNVSKFTMNQLIELVTPNLPHHNVMLKTIKSLRTLAENAVDFQSSITDIIAQNNMKEKDSFKKYIVAWSGSNDLANLLDRSLNTLTKTLGKSERQMDEMTLLEVINGLHITFGLPCTESSSSCICKVTMYGRRCQCPAGQRYVRLNVCVDLDECAFTKLTCSANAECFNTLGSYQCLCKKGFTGDGTKCSNIDECIESNNNCSKDAVCVDTIGSYNCRCNSGYRDVNGVGRKCDNINECAKKDTYQCHADADCIDTPGSYKCKCKEGFTGDGKLSCEDVNECSSQINNCSKQTQDCVNTVGSFKCVCKDRFIKVGASCYQCTSNRLEYCTENSDCNQNKCDCKKGFTKRNEKCEDTDECKFSSTCGPGTCINTIGSYLCECDHGFTLNDDNTTCIDVDECRISKVSLCNGTYQSCKNEYGSYACITEKPNTELKIGLGVSIPLVVILAILMVVIYFCHRRRQGNKELQNFDNKLNAMYSNKAYDDKEDNDDVKLTSDTGNLVSNRPVRYIFNNENQPKEDVEKNA